MVSTTYLECLGTSSLEQVLALIQLMVGSGTSDLSLLKAALAVLHFKILVLVILAIA
jgi:hypothetical protein